MTTQEFSAEFDVLYNNITSNQAPGLNEYEKSVFLTKAQSQLVNEYFNVRTDGVGGGFDGNQRRQYDFSSLISTTELEKLSDTHLGNFTKLDKRSTCFLFPEDYFLAVNESLSDTKYQYTIFPLSYDEYSRLMLKPYAYPVKKGAWRLFTGHQMFYSSISNNGSTLGITLDSPVTITFGSIKIPNNNGESKWWEGSPFDTVLGGSFPSLEDLIPVKVANGIAFRISTSYAFGVYVEVFRRTVLANNNFIGDSFQIRIFLMGSQALILPDPILIKYTGEAIEKYVKAHSEISDLDYLPVFKELYDITGNLSKANIKGSTFCKLDRDNITSYTASYSDLFIGNTFESASAGTYTIAEIIGRFTSPLKYSLRYIRRPVPIILVDLDETNYDGLSIEGVSTVSECELPEESHQEILERAVTLAKIAWQGGTATQAASSSNTKED